jgi:hypothetical protein
MHLTEHNKPGFHKFMVIKDVSENTFDYMGPYKIYFVKR